eukprot:COSAG02_NODE_970_length_15551_cov_4.985698_2_plen_148_part_00
MRLQQLYSTRPSVMGWMLSCMDSICQKHGANLHGTQSTTMWCLPSLVPAPPMDLTPASGVVCAFRNVPRCLALRTFTQYVLGFRTSRGAGRVYSTDEPPIAARSATRPARYPTLTHSLHTTHQGHTTPLAVYLYKGFPVLLEPQNCP